MGGPARFRPDAPSAQRSRWVTPLGGGRQASTKSVSACRVGACECCEPIEVGGELVPHHSGEQTPNHSLGTGESDVHRQGDGAARLVDRFDGPGAVCLRRVPGEGVAGPQVGDLAWDSVCAAGEPENLECGGARANESRRLRVHRRYSFAPEGVDVVVGDERPHLCGRAVDDGGLAKCRSADVSSRTRRRELAPGCGTRSRRCGRRRRAGTSGWCG